MKKLYSTMLVLAFLVSISFAQESNSSTQPNRTGKFGLGIDGISSPNLAVKYFFKNNIAMEVTAGFNLYSPGGDEFADQTKVTGTDIRFGLAFLYHFMGNNFVPYLGIDGLFESNKSGGFYVHEPDAKNSVQTNLIVGGEYFIAKQFSIGLKEKLGFDFQLSRDIPKEETEFRMNTNTIITARYYFN